MKLRGLIYRTIMRIAHKYNWHYAPPIYPDRDTQLWCKWCGFGETISKNKGLAQTLKEEIVITHEVEAGQFTTKEVTK